MFTIKMDTDLNLDLSFLQRIKLLFSREMKRAKRDIIKRLNDSIKENHRYQHDTRNLRKASYVKDKTKLLGNINLRLGVDLSKAYYGKYIINGQRSWSPDPFVDRAWDDNKDWVVWRLNKAVEKVTTEVNRKQ